ncbi:MAG: hypothetical protein RR182_00710 [Alistipes sp.]
MKEIVPRVYNNVADYPVLGDKTLLGIKSLLTDIPTSVPDINSILPDSAPVPYDKKNLLIGGGLLAALGLGAGGATYLASRDKEEETEKKAYDNLISGNGVLSAVGGAKNLIDAGVGKVRDATNTYIRNTDGSIGTQDASSYLNYLPSIVDKMTDSAKEITDPDMRRAMGDAVIGASMKNDQLGTLKYLLTDTEGGGAAASAALGLGVAGLGAGTGYILAKLRNNKKKEQQV